MLPKPIAVKAFQEPQVPLQPVVIELILRASVIHFLADVYHQGYAEKCQGAEEDEGARK
jgi:hypothetical protein